MIKARPSHARAHVPCAPFLAQVEKLRLAAEMLPPDAETQRAALFVIRAGQALPWELADAFVAHFAEQRANLRLGGPADPTGRGFGYSFTRDVRHKAS